MTVEIVQTAGTHLSGRLKGRKDFGAFCKLLSSVQPGELVVLDFKGVEYASSSWISATLVPLVRRAADETNDFFILITRFPPDSLDDLELVADQTRVPFLVTTGPKSSPATASLVGVLDTGQQETLSAVQELGEVTGASLERKRAKSGVKATAWNNRLRDLCEKRLLRRRKQGREQFYSTVIQEIIAHG